MALPDANTALLHHKSRSFTWDGVTIGLLLIAVLLYLHGFRGLLPYYLDPDEPHFYLAASEIRLTGRVQINPLYPPLRPYQMVATVS